MALTSKYLVVVAHSLIWVVLLSYSNVCYATETDIYCLKTIKNSLQDPNNYLNFSWNFNNNTEGFICKFAGIDCWHPDENRVLNIRLSDMGLKGQFPRGIRNCSSLTGLDLSNNKLSGSIPSDISELLRFVTTLELSSNSFAGDIPPSLANCSYLNVLKLDNNRLTGTIPLQLSQLNRLKTFSVANNLLTGQIPNINSTTREDYANNPGLCGKPFFDPCQASPKKSRIGIIAGAAVGGVTITVIVVVIILYYISRGVVIKKKKKEDDPDGNKWTKSIKGLKGFYVGGDMLDAALLNMRIHGRIAICGMVSQTSLSNPQGIHNMYTLITKRITMKGFLQSDYLHLFPRFVEDVSSYYKQGKIVYIEDMNQGLESAPVDFVGLFSGKNVGKQVICVAPE